MHRVERLDGAAHTPHDHQRRRAVQRPTEGADVGWQRARLDAARVHDRHQQHHQQLHHCLHDESYGHQRDARTILAQVAAGRGGFGGAYRGDGLDGGADVDEKDQDPVRVQHGVHGEVVHEMADHVVCGGRVDGRREINQDILRNVHAEVAVVVAGYAA